MRLRTVLAAAMTTMTALTITAGAATSAAAEDSPAPVLDVAMPAAGLFGTDSFWKQPLTGAPVHEDSAALVANIAGQVATRYGGVAAFNLDSYGASIYTVSAEQPRIDVVWNDCQNKRYVPTGLLGPEGQFTAVPIPADAVPAAGTDGELSIYSPATDQLWEFWKAKKVNGQWTACWGGRIDSVSTNPGHFSGYWGVSASGVSYSAGAVGIREVQAGRIEHALQLQLPEAQKEVYSWPAQRTDGTAITEHAVPQGMRLRLDPTLNVDAMKMHPIAKMIAKAAQEYGFIVSDTAGAVAVVAEAPTAVTRATGTNPWTALKAGTPNYNIMKGFPWAKLQAMPFDHGKPTPTPEPTPTPVPIVQ